MSIPKSLYLALAKAEHDVKDDPDRKATPEDLRQLWDPIMAELIAQHGKEGAKRIFREAIVAAGLNPNEVRVVFTEDLS